VHHAAHGSTRFSSRKMDATISTTDEEGA